MSQAVHIPFDNQYAHLSARLSSPQQPSPVKQPGLIRINDALATLLAIDPESLRSEAGVAVLSGNAPAEGAEPIATAYAGHQFGSWNPQLGDGRAILLGEVVGTDGQRYDIQLKGAGTTPYSRMGDGRSPLGPVLREYIVSEAMAAMGVATTRALAAVTTGEPVFRDQLLDGGILTRVASSHVRVGTFQYFAARQDWESVRLLADHMIDRHYPNARHHDNPYLELLRQVIERQASLIAHWQSLGFIHGVMNTDNMLVCGETVDYGPCAFMESYHPDTVFSSIDHGGRYAYGNQPAIGQWNLAWLAQSLLQLIDSDEDRAIKQVQTQLDAYIDRYLHHYQQRMYSKLGLPGAGDDHQQLLLDFLNQLAHHKLDFTLGFRVLSDLIQGNTAPPDSVAALYPLPADLHPWLEQWRQALAIDTRDPAQCHEMQLTMNAINPIYIPRNHQVEAAIEEGYSGNFERFHAMVDRLSGPFAFDPNDPDPIFPAGPEQAVTKTFCGT